MSPKRQSIRARLRFGLVLATVFFAVSVGAFWALNERLLGAIDRARVLDETIVEMGLLKDAARLLAERGADRPPQPEVLSRYRDEVYRLGSSVAERLDSTPAELYPELESLLGAVDALPATLPQELAIAARGLEERVDEKAIQLRAGLTAAYGEIQRERHRPLALGLALTALLAAVGGAYGYALFRRFNAFLADMTEVTRRAGAGELEVRGQVQAPDELGRITEEFNAMLERLRIATRDLEEFASLVSHDLQAPLRHLRAYAGILAESSPGEKQVTDAIQTSAARLSRLVEDLLAFSRVSAEGLAREWVELAELQASVAEELAAGSGARATPAARAPVIRCEGSARIHGVKSLLRALLVNLESNSLKYARPGVPPRIVVSLRTLVPDEHEVIVQDNGLGVPEDQRKRVFQLFRRLEREEGAPGHGIGLALCEKIARAHGGTIRIAPSPEGTRIVVTLRNRP